MPYHLQESHGHCELIFIDECGFNLHNNGNLYGWSQKGKPCIQNLPLKTKNTTFLGAINNKGVVAYQLFDEGIHAQDFLGFMSNVIEKLIYKNTIYQSTSNLE